MAWYLRKPIICAMRLQRGDRFMTRIACILVLCAAFACAICATGAVAFTTDVESSINPGVAAGYVTLTISPRLVCCKLHRTSRITRAPQTNRARINRAGSSQLRRNGEDLVHRMRFQENMHLAGSA